MSMEELRARLAELESNLHLADADMADNNLSPDTRYHARLRRKRVFIGMCQVNSEINEAIMHCHDPPHDPFKECQRNGHAMARDGFCARCGKSNKFMKVGEDKVEEPRPIPQPEVK